MDPTCSLALSVDQSKLSKSQQNKSSNKLGMMKSKLLRNLINGLYRLDDKKYWIFREQINNMEFIDTDIIFLIITLIKEINETIW